MVNEYGKYYYVKLLYVLVWMQTRRSGLLTFAKDFEALRPKREWDVTAAIFLTSRGGFMKRDFSEWSTTLKREKTAIPRQRTRMTLHQRIESRTACAERADSWPHDVDLKTFPDRTHGLNYSYLFLHVHYDLILRNNRGKTLGLSISVKRYGTF